MKESSRRSYRKRAFWEGHIGIWKGGSLSQAEYCRQNNLKEKSFTYWKRRLKVGEEEIRFVAVPYEIPPVMKSGMPIKVVVKDRYLIEVSDGFTPDTLRQVLGVLEVA
jgi:hypothetical protein